ncbi:hypothetical protein GQ53DRAFT_742315 [Thozetella sp. PMI_491]|nr:hypothetical protein GQ53DRAFT_742315 [Thozetella sp. PMI_491]
MVRLGEDRGLLAKLVAGFLLFLYLSPQYMTDEEIAKALDEQELSALDAFHLWRKRYLTDAERNEETVTAEEMILGEEWQDLDLKSIHERISPRACFELARDRCNFNADMTAFFETEKGYFGIGPILTEPEDEIFALPGLEIPFVMCAQDDNYEMLGPCFVLGFMDGEAVELMNSGQSQLQDLVVR